MKKAFWIVAVCGGLVFGVLAGGRVLLRKNVYTLALFNRLFTDEELLTNLKSEDSLIRITALSILEERRSPVAIEYAEKLLVPDSDWIGGAMYLAALGRDEVIPYLIAGLKHPAKGLRLRCAKYLTTLTGQQWGADFDRWLEWWKKENPHSSFDFEGLVAGAERARSEARVRPVPESERAAVEEFGCKWVGLLADERLRDAWALTSRKFRNAVGGYEEWTRDYLSLDRAHGLSRVAIEKVERCGGKNENDAYEVRVAVQDSQDREWLYTMVVRRRGKNLEVEFFSFFSKSG